MTLAPTLIDKKSSTRSAIQSRIRIYIEKFFGREKSFKYEGFFWFFFLFY